MKTWFITGTSTGMGRMLTEKLLAQGHRVAATIRKPGALDELKQKYRERLLVFTLDVTDPVAVKEVVNLAFSELGRIDVIVNNAGYALFGAAEESTDEQISHQFETNLFGSIRVIRSALPHLRAQGGGNILQLSSSAGQTVYPAYSYYNSSKWAIEGFCDTLAFEVAAFNIHITIIELGAHKTSFGAGIVDSPIHNAYDQTIVGEMRRMIAAGNFKIRGDVDLSSQAMIDIVNLESPPRRLALGADAYQHMREALKTRLEALEAQEDIAMASEIPD
ncbi:SDR family oxidoreductase [Pedobacter sp. Leaf194]|uniref:SDR family oxidoreductase n=1 Tax=Pedobacter sp. Leaf194 TaxID=1736297 RepID=UPI0007035CC4|nr:SDR family oxidoreductase [Pedobacter sp. Leaf194]KQS41790.1 short-chain dehydrogenase [Pedobacter sp. Leaf194]RYE59070.1 MAG: SDR family oxidoreductase [Sphingobacteriales bacterium]